MAKKELFWLGVGVINIDGKDYGAEMPLPVGSIDKGNLKKMIGDGRIGEKISTVVVDGRDNKIAELEADLAEITIGAKKTIKGLEKELKKADSGKCENCNDKDLRIVELDSEVKRISGENTGLTVDAEEKAALIKEQKATIKDMEKAHKKEIGKLTADLEEATKPAGDQK